jgi:hypothetical protein
LRPVEPFQFDADRGSRLQRHHARKQQEKDQQS